MSHISSFLPSGSTAKAPVLFLSSKCAMTNSLRKESTACTTFPAAQSRWSGTAGRWSRGAAGTLLGSCSAGHLACQLLAPKAFFSKWNQKQPMLVKGLLSVQNGYQCPLLSGCKRDTDCPVLASSWAQLSACVVGSQPGHWYWMQQPRLCSNREVDGGLHSAEYNQHHSIPCVLSKPSNWQSMV